MTCLTAINIVTHAGYKVVVKAANTFALYIGETLMKSVSAAELRIFASDLEAIWAKQN